MKKVLLLLSFFVSAGLAFSQDNNLMNEDSISKQEVLADKGLESENTHQENQISETNSVDYGDWIISCYVDDFYEFTDEKYMMIKTYGMFSNSFTRNSSLKVEMLVDKKSIRFKLYEYGKYLVKDESVLNFKAKSDDGEIIEFDAENYGNGYYHVSTKKQRKKIISLLLKELPIDFVGKYYVNGSMVSKGTVKREYHFMLIDVSGFSEAWQEVNK